MRAGVTITVLVFVSAISTAAAQSPRKPAPPPAPPQEPLIGCASLANLRTVLRTAKDDATSAVAIVSDPKSDLGCAVLDRKSITGIADHVGLNGRAYECLSQANTSICQWTKAGSVAISDAPSLRKTPAANANR